MKKLSDLIDSCFLLLHIISILTSCCFSCKILQIFRSHFFILLLLHNKKSYDLEDGNFSSFFSRKFVVDNKKCIWYREKYMYYSVVPHVGNVCFADIKLQRPRNYNFLFRFLWLVSNIRLKIISFFFSFFLSKSSLSNCFPFISHF